jgi:hypothetical protein
MKERELVCCSHLLDFCTRHLVIQGKIRIHIRYAETHPIISLSSPTHNTSLFWFEFEKCVLGGGGGGGEKFCTRHYLNTHTIGKDRRGGS